MGTRCITKPVLAQLSVVILLRWQKADTSSQRNEQEFTMKTKTYIFVITVLVASLLLAGCRGQAITTVAASSGLSAATKLAAGTLKLQDTSNAITSSQASELLTLWEAYQSMSNSDTTS
jgi:outer membrane murein-binding lipoprotein Lpp